MQEDWKVAPDLAVAEPDHLGRRRADNDIVSLDEGQTEQAVANGAADFVDFHAAIIP
jgi:hypothetical protein